MPSIHGSSPLRAIVLVVVAAAALVVAASPASARHPSEQRLVVRAEATAVDGPCSPPGVCTVDLTGGRFSGTPLAPGAYSGTLRLDVAHAFPNGDGGICAPLEARLVLGEGTYDRLVLALRGTSCQDGGGPLDAASFTALARARVVYGTGRYAGASGRGLATFAEDAANHHRLTLIGRLTR